MRVIAFLAVAISHGLASVNFFRAMHRGDLPKSIDFTSLSLLLYFDLGLALEASGIVYNNPYFPNFFEQDERLQIVTTVVIALTPWLLRIGSSIVRVVAPAPMGNPVVEFRSKKYFHLFAALVSFGAVGLAIKVAFSATVIWQARFLVGSALGPYIIILFVPLYLLAVHAAHRGSQSFRGKLFALFLAAAAIVATIPVGQRTFMLLPLLIFTFFYSRVSLERVMIAGTVAIVCAALILPLFKAQKSTEDNTTLTLLQSVADSDFSRTPVLADSIRRSRTFGTKILPYEGYGYVYSALYFVPRSLAPFKGYSTAQVFTAVKVGTSVEDTDWGFGISAIDEIILNFGLLAVIPGLIGYGLCIEAIDRLSFLAPVLIVPNRLAAIWLFGYHFPALLQDFGGMAVLGVVLQLAFSRVGKPEMQSRPQLISCE